MTSVAKLSAWATHVVYLRAARTFVEACEAEGIPALLVKGIVTAHTLYDDPADRALRDVDVRIRPEDYERVGALASARRWQLVEVKRAYRNYVLEVAGVQIDVECHVGPPHTCGLSVDEMMAREVLDDRLGFRARVPEFTDHAIVLVVNAFKDKLVLAQHAAVEDLVRVGQRHEFDPKLVADGLRAARVATAGWIVADYLARERASSAWQRVRELLPPLRRRVYEWALRRSRARPGGTASIVLARLCSDDAMERALAIATLLRWAAERRSPSAGS